MRNERTTQALASNYATADEQTGELTVAIIVLTFFYLLTRLFFLLRCFMFLPYKVS